MGRPSIGRGWYHVANYNSNRPPPVTNPGAGGISSGGDLGYVNIHLPIQTLDEAVRHEEMARQTTDIPRARDIRVLR